MCDEVVRDLSEIPPRDATMGKDGDVLAHAHRNTEVRFAPHDFPFSAGMEQHAFNGNVECKWGYEITGREAIQFAKYGAGQHYNWHVDNFPLHGGDTDRKVTVVVLLNDPSEFEGGEFHIRLYQEYVAPLVKGSVIAFPSILEHRVTPVTKGVRMSATMWLYGPRFR
jgi:PKHD-type hydroxylase